MYLKNRSTTYVNLTHVLYIEVRQPKNAETLQKTPPQKTKALHESRIKPFLHCILWSDAVVL